MSVYVFKLPDIGEGVTEAEIVEWHVAVGAKVEEDDMLVDIMTDKATVELTSPVAGTVVSLAGAVGDRIATGAELVVIDLSQEGDSSAAPDVSAPTEAPDVKPDTETPPQASAGQSIATAAAAELPAATRPLASPAVRRRASELGIDLADVRSSNAQGLIRQADLDAYVAYREPQGAAAPHGEGETIRLVGLRRRIAERMQAAKRHIPHFSYIEEVDVTALETLRAEVNAAYGETRPKLTLLPFIIGALSRAVPHFPQVNARFDDEAEVLRLYSPLHVGIATQTPAGLLVPVVRNAEARDPWDCSTEIARLAAAARAGKSSAADLSGSTITITSLGALGGIATTPVINRPEVAIIGVNKVAARPVVVDGAVVVRQMMNLSSSFDHRIVDGHYAASFIQMMKALLEAPVRLVLPED